MKDTIRKEINSEKHCDYCGLEMTFVKKPFKNRWCKPTSYYKCSCGNQFRVRSYNELLRDIGERK